MLKVTTNVSLKLRRFLEDYNSVIGGSDTDRHFDWLCCLNASAIAVSLTELLNEHETGDILAL